MMTDVGGLASGSLLIIILYLSQLLRLVYLISIATLSINTMSFSRVALYPANPTTARGAYTKLSASKEKIIYANGKTVFVSIHTFPQSCNTFLNGITSHPQIRDIAVSASFSMHITLLLIVRGKRIQKESWTWDNV